jgi:uncharacterized protein (TIGR02452 family)
MVRQISQHLNDSVNWSFAKINDGKNIRSTNDPLDKKIMKVALMVFAAMALVVLYPLAKLADKIKGPTSVQNHLPPEKDSPPPPPEKPAITGVYQAGPSQSQSEFRKAIFEETLKICEDGGYTLPDGAFVKIDNQNVGEGTITYDTVKEINTNYRYPTQFTTIPDDTFNVLLKRKREGIINPVGINMANCFHRGGGVKDGTSAQEESLCRRSNLYKVLKTQNYPLKEKGGKYSPRIQIFREFGDGKSGYKLMEKVEDVAIISVAAYDLRDGSMDRQDLGLPPSGGLDDENSEGYKKFISGTREKFSNMLRVLWHQKHQDIVLGALGCGAFKNPPKLIAKIFKEILESNEFKGAFRSVDFAVLNIFPNDQDNIDAFTDLCTALNPIPH